MDNRNFWWKRDFIESEYGTSNYVDHEGCVLPFKEYEDRLEIGFIGPYSLAYAENLDVKEKIISSAWSILIKRYPNKDIYIRLPPVDYYNDLYKINLKVIEKFQGVLIYTDTNHHINLSGSFESKIRRNRVRDLKKSLVFGLVFKQISIIDAYNIIEKNRINKNLMPSVKVQSIVHLSAVIPQAINSFGVYEQNNLIAASITYKISNSLVYVFMWGHDPDAENGGLAITSLCKGLFDYYQNESVKILCLGTSSVKGQLDLGLANFKLGLGAVESERKVMKIPKSE
jgi:hypothetical protein